MMNLKRTLAAACLLTAALTLAAAAPAAARRVEAAPYKPLGRMVDAGGHRLHLYCTGRGGPTVLVENGTGDFSFDWSLVQPSVARFTRICTYDRAGYAWSEPGPTPRTFRQLTTELHTALQNAGVRGPYVVVGQSYGGFLARAFARFYPGEVVGAVLVEAVSEDSRVIIGGSAVRLRELARGLPFPPPRSGAPDAAEKVSRASAPESSSPETKLEPPLDKLPPRAQQIRLWAQAQPVYEAASAAEREWSPEELAQMYANRGKPEYMLGDMPLVVLTRGEGGYEDLPNASARELEEERLRLQAELARLSRNGRQVIDKKSGHNIHLEDPGLVIDSIRQVVEAARGKRALRATESAPRR
jgi:pimeloyl-ACP methyl ester carboxylesterase